MDLDLYGFSSHAHERTIPPYENDRFILVDASFLLKYRCSPELTNYLSKFLKVHRFELPLACQLHKSR
jgi:hypothetical protein